MAEKQVLTQISTAMSEHSMVLDRGAEEAWNKTKQSH